LDLRRLSGRLVVPLLTIAAIAALSPAPALAGSPGSTSVAGHSQAKPAAKTRLDERQATAIARRAPAVARELARFPHARPRATFTQPDRWQVDFLLGSDDIAQAVVDDRTDALRESWTGYQIEWAMARGYPGAFGRKVNSPYVWLPLCALFFLGLADLRRPLRLVNLDLLALLAFGVSHFFFNRGDVGLSVPLAYPVLVYLFARMLWVGFRGAGGGLRPTVPVAWLAIAALFLVGFRVGLDVADSNVIDVGYSGVIGADRLAHDQALYGNFPADNPYGDTYGPAAYYPYVPFELIWPWHGHWDDLPAAHAAAVLFDLLTLAGLFLLGRRLRAGPAGTALGAILAFAWAAYPYSAFALESNSNDSLVAALLVATLLVASRPLARGATLALAAATKFAPLVLLPLAAVCRPLRWRSLALFAAGFAAVLALVMASTALGPGLGRFYDRTLGFQASRGSPFSIWGQEPSLEWLQTALKVATALLALALAIVPRRRDLARAAALSAALVIAVELTAEHWFYLYVVWFFPLVAVALTAPGPEPARSTPPGHRAGSPPAPP
jgi:hypothetical protein